MKTTNAERPRLMCRLTRIRLAFGGDAHRNAHVGGCADCRAWLAAEQGLTAALRRDAIRCEAQPPAGMEGRILRAVRESSVPRPAARPAWSGWVFAGLAAGAAAVALVMLDPARLPAPVENVAANEVSPEEMRAVGAAVSRWFDSVGPAAQALLSPETLRTTDPLQREVDAFYADARSAVAFLALNFLPASQVEAFQERRNARDTAGG